MMKNSFKFLVFVALVFFNSILSFSQEKQNSALSCEMVSDYSNDPFLLESPQPFRKTYIYFYKDYILYSLSYPVNNFVNGVQEPPTNKALYFLGKNGNNFLYTIKDSLTISNLNIKRRFNRDSTLIINTVMLNPKVNFLDTTKFKLISIKKGMKKVVLKVNDLSTRVTISNKNYVVFYLSKRKTKLSHQIIPYLDTYFGMRTYKVYTSQYYNNRYTWKDDFELKKVKVSSLKAKEIIDFFEECDGKIFN